jgi:hypothetical protein
MTMSTHEGNQWRCRLFYLKAITSWVAKRNVRLWLPFRVIEGGRRTACVGALMLHTGFAALHK